MSLRSSKSCTATVQLGAPNTPVRPERPFPADKRLPSRPKRCPHIVEGARVALLLDTQHVVVCDAHSAVRRCEVRAPDGVVHHSATTFVSAVRVHPATSGTTASEERMVDVFVHRRTSSPHGTHAVSFACSLSTHSAFCKGQTTVHPAIDHPTSRHPDGQTPNVSVQLMHVFVSPVTTVPARQTHGTDQRTRRHQNRHATRCPTSCREPCRTRPQRRRHARQRL